MSDPTVHLTKPAGELHPGDRISAAVLPGSLTAGDVLFVYPYTGRDTKAWVFVAYREPGYSPESERFLAGTQIPVEFGDPTGLSYTRADTEADDPTPVSPGRVPLHTGSVVDGDALVVDAEASAAGAPPRDRRTCVDPGDHEHDHESCKDAVAEYAGDPATDAVLLQIIGQGPGGPS